VVRTGTITEKEVRRPVRDRQEAIRAFGKRTVKRRAVDSRKGDPLSFFLIYPAFFVNPAGDRSSPIYPGVYEIPLCFF